MSKKLTPFIAALVAIIFLGGGGYFWYKSKTAPGKYDELAQCLSKKEVKMFGAYWCPACKQQKKDFGNSWRFIDYIECSLPNGAGQTKKCNNANIQSYPTWEFANNKRLIGKIQLEELADTAGCLYK